MTRSSPAPKHLTQPPSPIPPQSSIIIVNRAATLVALGLLAASLASMPSSTARTAGAGQLHGQRQSAPLRSKQG